MTEIIINAERTAVSVYEDGKLCKGFCGSEEQCEMNAQRWAKQYNVDNIIYESIMNAN